MQQPQRKPGTIATFFAKPAHVVFAWTFGVLMLLAGCYAYLDISLAVSDLEADGNQFAGLVWAALPVRLINDGIIVAMIAGVVTIIAVVTNRKR